MISDGYYYTREASKKAGIHRDTLLRWLREGKIAEPKRDRNNWRIFTPKEVNFIVDFVQKTNLKSDLEAGARQPYSDHISRLTELNWDFSEVNTEFLNHSIHPYPCKFIPQIPNTLIQELSSIGDTVIDPFAGSGTTLVEALRLGRNAVGVDANPLSALICKVKTNPIEYAEAEELFQLADKFIDRGHSISSKQMSLFGNNKFTPDSPFAPEIQPWIQDWFNQNVINELLIIKDKCLELEPTAVKELALIALSSIIVAVSRQDSDTRYVRREKNIGDGDTFRRFGAALRQIVTKQLEFSSEIDRAVTAKIFSANLLEQPKVPPFELLVSSPPYPNAYSYHLYHRSRMLWLGMDPDSFKKNEIGSHRKYSSKSKNAATIDTFKKEMGTIFLWVSRFLRTGRHACFVIGDSTIRGKKVRNDELLIDVAKECGFSLEANISRNLQATKKSFNPSIGKIKNERIVILRNDVKETDA